MPPSENKLTPIRKRKQPQPEMEFGIPTPEEKKERKTEGGGYESDEILPKKKITRKHTKVEPDY